MKSNRKITTHPPRASVMEVLEAHLNRPDEAAWYAERIERLGRVMFGDLWNDDESGAAGGAGMKPPMDTNEHNARSED